MKKNQFSAWRSLIVLLTFLGMVTVAEATPSIDGKLVNISASSSTLVFKLQIKASTAIGLGTSSFLIDNYDPSYMHLTGQSYANFRGGNYSTSTTKVVESSGLNVNIVYNGSTGGGTTVPTTFIDVCTITMTIDSPTKSISLIIEPFNTNDVVEDDCNDAPPGTNFASGTLTGSSTPLPVTLLSFSGFLQKHETVLNWVTASEINNAYFTVERSQDGNHFSPILTKQGSGNSTIHMDYTAYDESPLAGTSYYRLRQTDYNGKTEAFNIIAVNNTNMGTFAINNISPTNFSDNTILNYTMPSEGNIRLVVTNMEGKIVSDEIVVCQTGDNIHQFNNTNNWKPGMYLVNLYCNGEMARSKMIKQ